MSDIDTKKLLLQQQDKILFQKDFMERLSVRYREHKRFFDSIKQSVILLLRDEADFDAMRTRTVLKIYNRAERVAVGLQSYDSSDDSESDSSQDSQSDLDASDVEFGDDNTPSTSQNSFTHLQNQIKQKDSKIVKLYTVTRKVLAKLNKVRTEFGDDVNLNSAISIVRQWRTADFAEKVDSSFLPDDKYSRLKYARYRRIDFHNQTIEELQVINNKKDELIRALEVCLGRTYLPLKQLCDANKQYRIHLKTVMLHLRKFR